MKASVLPLMLVAALLAGCGSSAGHDDADVGGNGGEGGEGGTGGSGGSAGHQDGASGTGGPDAAAGSAGADASVDSRTVEPDSASPDRAGPDGSPDQAMTDTTPAGSDGTSATLVLTSTGFLMKGADLIFPASASYPMDHSPPFAWSGAPATSKSFALTFVDKSNGATKWVLWDIPVALDNLPGDVSKGENPAEIPGSTQRGSLGRTGYSGPGVPGPPLHTYEFVIWALDVAKLPGTTGASTETIRTKLLPMHAISMSAPLVAKGQEGGP
jgi:Raf kinase inhibitor-like YbhB/YbcL family protein